MPTSKKQLTIQELFDKFVRLAFSNSDVQGRWIPDKEFLQYLNDFEDPNHDRSAPTSISSFNTMLTKRCSLSSDCFKFPKLNENQPYPVLLYGTNRKQFKLEDGSTTKMRFFFVTKPWVTTEPSRPPKWEAIRLQYETKAHAATSSRVGLDDETIAAIANRSGVTKRSKKKMKRTVSAQTQNADDDNGTANSNSQKRKETSASDFDTKLEMLRSAWYNMYGEESFPDTHIGFVDRSNAKLPPPTHRIEHTVVASRSDNNTETKFASYNTTTQTVISNKEATGYRRDKQFVDAVRSTITTKINTTSTIHSKNLLAAFSVAHPQIAVDNIANACALGRYTLLLDIMSSLTFDFDWITLENITNSAPSSSSLENWIVDLAKIQVMIVRYRLSPEVRKFLQTDGGHLGQEVRLLSWYDPDIGEIIQFWIGLSYTGKKSEEVAEGIRLSLALFCRGGTIDGSTSDSGQGTPESFGDACRKLKIYAQHAEDHSCGIHDVQSVFRLATLHCIGEGGLDAENAIQLLHTLYSMFLQNRPYWSELVSEIYNKLQSDEEGIQKEVPKDLCKAVQEPLITRWWTQSVLASLYTKYSKVYNATAQATVNSTTTVEKTNTISSNLMRMAGDNWIVADVFFLSGVSDCWLNRHMQWYQAKDPKIGTPGYLSVHRAARYYLQIRDVDTMEKSWKTNKHFAEYGKEYEKLNPTMKAKKDKQRSLYFDIMRNQIHKHNRRYLLNRTNFIRSIFSERKIGVLAIRIITRTTPSSADFQDEDYESPIHGTSINLRKLYAFWKERISDEVCDSLRAEPSYVMHENDIELILSGIDIWNGDCKVSKRIRNTVKCLYCAQASTQHNNERLVKIASRMIATGRKERMANIYFIASNGFIVEYFDSDEDGNDNDGGGGGGGGGESAEDDSSPKKRMRKRGNNRGLRKLLDIEKGVNDLEEKYAAIAAQIGHDAFNAEIDLVKKQFENFDNDSQKRTREKTIIKSMMDNFEKTKTNSRITKKCDGKIKPIINGYISYSKFCRNKHLELIGFELKARDLEAEYESTKGVKKMQALLIKNEKKRFESEVEIALTSLRVSFVATPPMKLNTKLALLKQAIQDSENCIIDWDDFNADIDKYFKKQSKNICDTINF